MSELESTIEKKLIDQLCTGDSQWTYRPNLHTEQGLWDNFRYILEQNNKEKLNDVPLSDSEFEQVKNQIVFSSFYDAGKWLVGESGLVQVHVQRGNDTLHLMVLNQEHIAGGKSVYEIINQYQALKEEGEDALSERDRRFDVTLMINGLPMIHIELKNREHSYMDGFRQIKKYIREGKFKGIFSAVQMFVVSNGVDTRYFSAARDTELNPKFLSQWLDEENKPVPGYLDFAKKVLRIPEAHEMVSKYTVLDFDAKRLLLLRPYQIHAIEAMREASKHGKSGYIWHTTGSGKTMTSYKATRNLLMDIPAIEKTVFLIDRKDLDTQTKGAFLSYADNDTIDVDETDNVTDLIKKLANKDRQMIVTTIQKMQVMMHRRLTETHPNYKCIKSLKIAFVVDECHRSVSPGTKREFESFFRDSLWYGFTGTPRFPENAYPKMGDLPRTTDELYGKNGKPLHEYTIKEAIHDEAVLGFMNEYLCDSDINPKEKDVNPAMYERESHMLMVLNTILNKSNEKFGIANGKGKTYEAILTTNSIKVAQKYYDLLKKVVAGETAIHINEDIKKVLPDFPKFAITYSVTENEEESTANQDKMKESMKDYNDMFGTHYDPGQMNAYNTNLNDRLARKMDKFKARKEQLDIVIVVDRLLTGFDAPCLSTLFIDRQPMQPHDIIQALSRTNRLFDDRKKYGQVVTFQVPNEFKNAVDNALKLFSAGGIGEALASDWEETENGFMAALADLRELTPLPADVAGLSKKEKKRYARIFQKFDSLLTQLKAFTVFDGKNVEGYGITESEYEDYNAHYHNVIEELRTDKGDTNDDSNEMPVNTDYEPQAFARVNINYEYIIGLIQDIVTPTEDETDEEFKAKAEEIRRYINEFSVRNAKLGDMMLSILDGVEKDRAAYAGKNISEILADMKHDTLNRVVDNFTRKWFVDRAAVMYAVENNNNGLIPNASILKDTLNYSEYKESTEEPLKKPKARSQMISELENMINEEIVPLQIGVNY